MDRMRQAYPGSGNKAYKTRVLHSVLNLFLVITLAGCATTATIDEEERNTLAKAPSVSMVLYPHVPFTVTTAMSQGLAGVFGTAVLTAGSDAQRGRDLIQRHRLPDPSTLVIEYFSAGLEGAYGLKNLDDTPSLQFSDDPAALRNALGGGLAFDFRTFYWRGGVQLGKKIVFANVLARLVDLGTGEVLWEKACGSDAKGSKETWENTFEINSVISAAAQDCTQQLLESFVEEANLPTALSAAEVAAVNWEKEMGETAAEFEPPAHDYLTSKEIIEVYSGGTWTGIEEGDRYWETYQPHKSIDEALAGKKSTVKGSWRDKPYTGRWWVEHNMLCVDFDGWDEDDDCWRMERVSDTDVRVYSQKKPGDIATESRTEN